MSFADEVRSELLALPVKKPCCRRALLLGLLLESELQQDQITLTLRGQAAAVAADLIRRQFGRTPQLREETRHGRRCTVLTFSSPAAAELLRALQSFGACAEEVIGFSCDGCRPAFLRGAFLSMGSVNDPHKSTHLEFFLHQTQYVDVFSSFLSACGYPAGAILRTGGVGLYYKDSNSVEDLIALTGAGRTAMEMMNIRIEREIRNQENRATNCVAKNIEKSVSAASRQIAAIEKLALTGMLAQLPESIRLTARLRAENPDATLEELRLLHVPPITKSGLNHRLQKLIAEAEK